MRLVTRISLLAGLTASFGTGCAALLGLDEFRESGGTGGNGSVSNSASGSSSVASGTGGDIGFGGGAASSATAASSSSGTGGVVDCNAGETIAAVQSGPNGITVTGSKVFWVNTIDGTVMEWQEGSVPGVWYTTSMNGPEFISATAHQVCWTDSNNDRVECYSDAAPNKTPHAILEMGASAQPSSIVIDDTYAYWTTPYSGDVKKRAVPADSFGSDKTVYSISSNPSSNPNMIAVDGAGTAYWVDYANNTIMKRAPGDIVQSPPLITSQPGISGLAVDADDVFWTNSMTKTVFKAPKVGGAPVNTFAANQLYPQQVTVDATDVYWWNQGDGTIMKAPKSGGAATVVICGQTDVHFAVGATHVYWTDRKKGTVKRIPK